MIFSCLGHPCRAKPRQPLLSRRFAIGYQLLPACGSLVCRHTQIRSGPKKTAGSWGFTAASPVKTKGLPSLPSQSPGRESPGWQRGSCQRRAAPGLQKRRLMHGSAGKGRPPGTSDHLINSREWQKIIARGSMQSICVGFSQ